MSLLGNLVLWEVSLLMAEGLDWMISKIPSNQNHSMNLDICSDLKGTHKASSQAKGLSFRDAW